VRPPHGPAAPACPRHSAATPATCGAAKLVPESVLYEPFGEVDFVDPFSGGEIAGDDHRPDRRFRGVAEIGANNVERLHTVYN